jgi:hypothetical protein
MKSLVGIFPKWGIVIFDIIDSNRTMKTKLENNHSPEASLGFANVDLQPL